MTIGCMKTHPRILPIVFFATFALLFFWGAPRAEAQAFTAVVLEKSRSFNVQRGQVMEIDSITGQPAAGTIRTGVSLSGFVDTTTYASKAPSWKLTFGGKSFNSDVTETNSSATSRGSITMRQALPRKIVGPATLVITPVKNAPFILNYRLVANK